MPGAVGPLFAVQGGGNPQAHVPLPEGEAAGHHADDRVLLAAQQNLLAHDPRVRPKPPPPEPVAEHHHRYAGPVVLVRDHAPERRGHPEHGEEAAGHRLGLDLLGLAVPGEHEAAVGHRGHVREHAALRLPVCVVGRGHVVAGQADLRCVLEDQHQPLRVGEGQGTHQDRIHEAEDRGRRSDAEGQGEDGENRRPRLLDQ